MAGLDGLETVGLDCWEGFGTMSIGAPLAQIEGDFRQIVLLAVFSWTEERRAWDWIAGRALGQ